MIQDGIIFIWLSWILFCIFTFFYKKTKTRLVFTTFILLMICSINKQIIVFQYQIDLSLIILCIFISLTFIKSMRKFYILSCSIGAAIGFAGLFILIQVFSITLFVSMYVLFPLIAIFLVGFLTRDFKQRLFILVSSATVGKIMYDAILVYYGLQSTFGSNAFLDELMLTVSIFVLRDLWSVFYKRITTKHTYEQMLVESEKI